MDDHDQQIFALKTLAYCVRAYVPWFATIERDRLDPSEMDSLRLYIDGLASKLEWLADIVPEGAVTYAQVEAVINELQDVGFYPPKVAIMAALHAFSNESKRDSSDLVSS
jgi:hypothetical protein